MTRGTPVDGPSSCYCPHCAILFKHGAQPPVHQSAICRLTLWYPAAVQSSSSIPTHLAIPRLFEAGTHSESGFATKVCTRGKAPEAARIHVECTCTCGKREIDLCQGSINIHPERLPPANTPISPDRDITNSPILQIPIADGSWWDATRAAQVQDPSISPHIPVVVGQQPRTLSLH